MTDVAYQVVYSKDADIKGEIEELLKEALEDNYVVVDEENLDFIEINYVVVIDDTKSIAGFKLDLSSIDADAIKLVQSFNEKLNDDENIAVVFKYTDNSFFAFLQKIYEELYAIEMKLREVVTLIFIDTYKDDFYNLLYETDVRLHIGLNKEVQKNREQKEQFLAKRLENEFFHVLFSDYVKLTKSKNLKQDDLFLIAEMSSNFDEFKDNILKRGIVKEKYLNFINSIKENMNNLEKVRNCVAHNRTPSDDDIYNYTLSKEDIIQKIDAFVESLNGLEEA